MAIVSLAKITLYGTADQLNAVLDGLQDLGCVHLINLNKPRSTTSRPQRAILAQETHDALKYLRSCPVQRREVKVHANFDFDRVVAELLCIKNQSGKLEEERDQLLAAIEQLKPWGSFHLPPRGALDDHRLWFYIIPHYRMKTLRDRDFVWEVVSRDLQNAYVVVVSPDEPADMPVPRVRLDDRPLSEVIERLDAVESELEDLHWQRVSLTRWRQLLSRTLAEADDHAARQDASQQTLDDPHVFAVQGWLPRRDLDMLREFTAEHELLLTVEDPQPEDSPPTLLHNAELVAGGEDAVTFYMTPGYRTWDPSAVVFVSFSVFFAMIMSDAGYALVLGGVLMLLWKRLGRSTTGRRFRRLACAIVLASVAYGVMVGSYFGLLPAAGSYLEALHVIDAGDTGLMMRISIVVGVVHLVLANLASAWRERRSLRMFASFGWSAILLGGLALGFGKSGTEPADTLVLYGTRLLAGGAIAVLLFSSDRPLFTVRLGNLAWRLFDGIKSLANVSRAFGDVLSYLRLFALGLASAQLAATFNELTSSASGRSGVGMLLAVLVVVFGHGLNFVLAIMSGVVHGLRLNCIEFFGWSLPEEGYPFQPFCKRALESRL